MGNTSSNETTYRDITGKVHTSSESRTAANKASGVPQKDITYEWSGNTNVSKIVKSPSVSVSAYSKGSTPTASKRGRDDDVSDSSASSAKKSNCCSASSDKKSNCYLDAGLYVRDMSTIDKFKGAAAGAMLAPSIYCAIDSKRDKQWQEGLKDAYSASHGIDARDCPSGQDNCSSSDKCSGSDKCSVDKDSIPKP